MQGVSRYLTDKINKIRNMNLRVKILLTVLPCCIFAISFVVVFSFVIFERYETQLNDSNVRAMRLVSSLFDEEMVAVDRVAGNVAEYYGLTEKILPIMNDSASDDRGVQEVAVYEPNGWKILYGSGETLMSLQCIPDMMAALDESDMSSVWYVADHPAEYIYNARYVRGYGSTTEDGLLIMAYDYRAVMDSILGTYSGDDGAGSYVVVLDDKGVLYSTLPNGSSVPWNEDSGNKYVKVDGETYFASFLACEGADWRYVILIPFKGTRNVLISYRIHYVCLTILVIVAAIFFCNILVKTITKRFDYLLTRVYQVKEGKFDATDVKLDDDINDELGQICQIFEDMVRELDELIKDNYLKQMLIRDNQLRVLKSQLNPHFLFNTLQMLNWQAKANKQEVISRTVEALGRLLRYTLEEDKDPVTLEEEVFIVSQYVMIQKNRYQERLNVSVEIPEELNREYIPKLTIQNMVENSIKYALENMLEPCYIRIWAEKDGEDYLVFVQDNGPGFPESMVGNVDPDAQAADKENPPVAGLGIGLNNVEERIQLMFTPKHGLRIYNTERGAMVELRLPRRV